MPLKVDFFQFRSNRIRFNEHHISYTEVSDIFGPDAITLYNSNTKIQRE